MNFLEASKPLNDSDIRQVENDLGLSFPIDFKKHYLKFNGGYPEKDTYKWKDGSITAINTFSSIKYEGFNSLEETYRNLILSGEHLSTGIVPFANDDVGNLFCISTRKDDNGSVYYCNNDHYNTENKEECLTLLETSFSSFLENLSSD